MSDRKYDERESGSGTYYILFLFEFEFIIFPFSSVKTDFANFVYVCISFSFIYKFGDKK